MKLNIKYSKIKLKNYIYFVICDNLYTFRIFLKYIIIFLTFHSIKVYYNKNTFRN